MCYKHRCRRSSNLTNWVERPDADGNGLQNIDGKMASVVDNLRTGAIDLLTMWRGMYLPWKWHRYYEHDTTNADVIANLGSKVASLLNLDLDAVDSRLTANMKELKDQLDSIHKTKSNEIDKLSQDVQAHGRWIYKTLMVVWLAIAALRTELKADTVEQLQSRMTYCRSRITWTWWDREYKWRAHEKRTQKTPTTFVTVVSTG
jgi:hypothetical protein